MTISILGCGWYGKALAIALVEKGITVKGSVTSTEKLEQLSACGIIPYKIKFEGNGERFENSFFKCDALFVCIPPKVRKGEAESYLSKIKNIIYAIVKYQISKVVYISSTGVYGEHNNVANELDDPKPDTDSGNILLEAEKLFHSKNVFKTTIIRFAGLVGPGRDPGRFFAGKKDIPNGMAPVNLIHLDDCIGISTAIIEKDFFGYLINASSPHHPTKAEFYCKASKRLGVEVPEFINELKRWKVVNSSQLSNLLQYEFKTPGLNGY